MLHLFQGHKVLEHDVVHSVGENLFAELQCKMFQRILIFIFTASRTSNLVLLTLQSFISEYPINLYSNLKRASIYTKGSFKEQFYRLLIYNQHLLISKGHEQ
jgi:hypothetical protein